MKIPAIALSCLTLCLMLPAGAAAQVPAAAGPTLRLPVQLVKSNKKGKLAAFSNKAGNLFKLESRLFRVVGEDPKGELLFEETQVLDIPVNKGQAIIELGKVEPLPSDLSEGDVLLTTMVTQLAKPKPGQAPGDVPAKATYSESDLGGLGIGGFTFNQILSPSEVHTPDGVPLIQGGHWVGPLDGLQGPPGADGSPGPQGPAGEAGPEGSMGPAGPQGDAGPMGPTGPTGATGAAGEQGDIGPAGPEGAAGPQGVPGVPGTQGPIGPQGATGPQGVAGPEFLGGAVDHLDTTGPGFSLRALNGSLSAKELVTAGRALETRTGFIHADGNDNTDMRLTATGSMEFYRDIDLSDPRASYTGQWFRWFSSSVSSQLVPERREIMRLDDLKQPNLNVPGAYVTGLSALAVSFPAAEQGLRAGDVVALDPQQPGAVRRARAGDGLSPVGVVTDEPGLILGEAFEGVQPELLAQADAAAEAEQPDLALELRQQWIEAQQARTDRVFVAVAGRVELHVDPSSAAIQPGDRLGVGLQGGHALRHTGAGASLGVALQAWTGGDALLPVLLLQSASGSDGTPALASPGIAGAHHGVWGSGTVPVGADSVVVQDASLTAQHLPVVTFYGDPGSRFWISERGPGRFVLKLAQPATAEVGFGFEAEVPQH